jgi:DNA (cytosine-5)-methyltransferase 1
MRGLIVDNFAGGGGASTGIAMALGREPDIAINHDREALIMHAANHPLTWHMREDVWNVDPEAVCGGKPVALAWFSPDCKHFSKAKGGKPVSKKIRGLAWVAVKWAKAVRPTVIILENVEEFRDWGPVLDDGMPCPLRRGLTYRRFVRALRNEGYDVQDRELRASDYGAPTSRKRLFLIARCDGKPITWPEPTHGPGRLPYRTAAECIDFSLPCPSIFDRTRPLAENTMRRIARGIQKFVLNNPTPFIVGLAHGEHKTRPGSRSHSIHEPLRTISAGGGDHAIVAPYLVPRYGERPGQDPRCIRADAPMPTIVPTQNGGALVAAFLAKHNGGNEATGQRLERPIDTVTATDSKAVVTSHLMKLRGKVGKTAKHGQQLTLPLDTITAGGNHYAEVRAFLINYYGEGGGQLPDINDPMATLRTRDHVGLVMVRGEPYQIVDIGMRMLTPRELFLAQGFPTDYIIDPMVDGKPLTARSQVRMCGNSVCPPIAEALVLANCGELSYTEVAA